MVSLRSIIGLLAAVVLLPSCSASETPGAETAVAFARTTEPELALPGWGSDRLSGWLQAWQRSCERRPWRSATAGAIVDKRAWQAGCDASRHLSQVGPEWITRHFAVLRVEPDAFVTGYFEPSVAGSRQPDPDYPVPLYRPPPRGSSFTGLSRAEIDMGGLRGQGLELLWLADPVDAFFLHIQGSGRVEFPDGTSQRVGFAGHNGRAYRAIGRDLTAMGAIRRKDLSMQSIATWLRAHPRQATAMMQKNPRYIFFQKVHGAGPIGAQGAALTPERSLAVDPAQIPYGLPVWLDVEHPDPPSGQRLQRLTIAQDTGSAIVGAGRADYFWGSGAGAAALAGRMRSQGRLYVLAPKPSGRR